MAAPTALASLAASSNAQLTRTLERLLEEAQNTGELRLNGRKLKELPSYAAKYDLRDAVYADLSKNRLAEFPGELCGLALLERLDCHSNVLRTVPPALAALQALTYLDLSRNQLTRLPGSLCQLPVLSVLLVSNNRLASLPEELGKLRSLMDLDASCNELEHLPPGVGELQLLRSLRVRRNRLQELPPELCRLRLWRLDVSENRLSRLPPPLRLMGCLRHLLLDGNPLVCPPAFLCRRGQVHVFKYLELEALKEDRRKGHLLDSADGRPGRTMVEHCAVNGHIADSKRSVDSGISDGGDSQRWSFEAPLSSLRSREDPAELWLSGGGGPTTPSTLSPCSETGPLQRGAFFEDPLDSGDSCGPGLPSDLQNGQSVSSSQEGSPNQNHSPAENGGGHIGGTCELPSRVGGGGGGKEAAPPPPRRVHQQTYREFKEALRQQRLAPVQQQQQQQQVVQQQMQQPQHRVTPEEEFRARHEAIVQRLEATWGQQRSSQPSSPLPTAASSGGGGARTPSRVTAATGIGDFTIRRGLERAREEQELIEQLRWVIESRLKVQLPPDVGPSLVDGVVLCHLANQVQPRSVASIHVPSAATPKLTLAKCRRNVENFLNACRQLGVPEGDLFAWEDLVLRVDVARVAATVSALAPATFAAAPIRHRGDRPLSNMLLATLAGTCLLLLWGFDPRTDPWWLPMGLCCGPYLHALLLHHSTRASDSSYPPPN